MPFGFWLSAWNMAFRCSCALSSFHLVHNEDWPTSSRVSSPSIKPQAFLFLAPFSCIMTDNNSRSRPGNSVLYANWLSSPAWLPIIHLFIHGLWWLPLPPPPPWELGHLSLSSRLGRGKKYIESWCCYDKLGPSRRRQATPTRSTHYANVVRAQILYISPRCSHPRSRRNNVSLTWPKAGGHWSMDEVKEEETEDGRVLQIDHCGVTIRGVKPAEWNRKHGLIVDLPRKDQIMSPLFRRRSIDILS